MAYPYQKKIDREELIKIIKKHKSICWYPSAGSDFRPLLFLTKAFYDKHEALSADKAVFPDLFIFTDYCAEKFFSYGPEKYIMAGERKIECTSYSDFERIPQGRLMERNRLFSDHNTDIYVNSASRIFIKDPEVNRNVIGHYLPPFFGTGYFMNVDVFSHHNRETRLGSWDMDVIYLYAENTAFAKHILIENQINVDFIVSVRYGGNFGGSTNFGGWLFHLADTLNVKYYISPPVDFIPDYQNDDVMEYLKEAADISFRKPRLTKLYERNWYENEVVDWYRVER